jgi:ribosomal protein S18 acetylase RimI-like enzyme
MTVIRPARPNDEPFLIALTRRLTEFPVPWWRTPAQVEAADHRLLRETLHAPSAETSVLVAEEPRGTPVGFVLTSTRQDYFTNEPHAHVEVLSVEPEAEGRGVGRLLMEAAEAWARERGYRRITLNVFAANDRAQGMYRHLGYESETVRYHKQLLSPA